MTTPDRPEIYSADVETQLGAFIDQHRQMLTACLDGLTEEEARARMVPSKTTLLGILKHAIFVERVWFEEARTGRPRAETGLPAGPDESFDLVEADSIESVRTEFLAVCARSRDAVRHAAADELWSGNRRGTLALRWIELHVLREHAQHCGHADILREQVLSSRR
jgi:hypothetical protein